MMNFLPLLSRWKRFLLTGLFVVGTMLVYALFPAEARLNTTAQSVLLGVAFFVALPILFVRLVLHEPLSALGFQGSIRRFGPLAVLFVVVPILLIWYALIRTFPVADAYRLPTMIRTSFPFFVLYEVVLVGAITFLYEVFFRGFVLILWLKKAGLWAVFFQVGLFASFVALTGKGLSWQDVPLLCASLASGFVASYTRSVPYAWVSAWLILFLSDVLILVIR
ncbi:MAG: hypothetical protein WCJ25_03690 [Candidatus Moraniibacteriota bacterium]